MNLFSLLGHLIGLSGAESPVSQTINFCTHPDRVQNLRQTAATVSSITVEWTAPVNDPSGKYQQVPSYYVTFIASLCSLTRVLCHHSHPQWRSGARREQHLCCKAIGDFQRRHRSECEDPVKHLHSNLHFLQRSCVGSGGSLQSGHPGMSRLHCDWLRSLDYRRHPRCDHIESQLV